MSIVNKKNLGGQYIHFGVREHGMAGIMNGIASTTIEFFQELFWLSLMVK